MIDERRGELRRLGVAESEIDQFLADEDEAPAHFAVHPDNWETVSVFMRLQSQWRHAPMGERIGLNYQSAQFVMSTLKVKDPQVTLMQLQTMEYAVLAAGSDARGDDDGGE